MAALLGRGDHPVHTDPGVLHGTRTSADNRQRQDAAFILRTTSVASILSETELHQAPERLTGVSLKRIDIALSDMLASTP
jgi:hypothetical protein